MTISPIPELKWTDRLAFDVALCLENSGEDMDDILKRHEINPIEMVGISKDPVFTKRVEAYRTEIRDKGVTFKMKARAQAEELLKTSWLLIHDPSVSAAVKADLIKSTVKWGGLEPKNDVSQDGNTGGVRITINLGGQEHQMKLIDSPVDATEVDEASDSAL